MASPSVKELIVEFDKFLRKHEATFEGVAIGASALILLDVITRRTKDCDILDPDIPTEIQQLSASFAHEMRKKGADLLDDWFNNGPKSLKRVLPKDWQNRIQPLFQGKALILHTLSRPDLLRTKLFAYCDRGTDRFDCVALKPSQEEIHEALDWVKHQDANPGWPSHVEKQINLLMKDLGYDVRS